MNEFERLQDDFQRAIMTGDESILADIMDSPKEKRDVLFGVYKYAYASRLVDALRSDHKLLREYIGDEMFDEMGNAYVAACPSTNPNIRWFSQGLPEFLRSSEPYSDYPVLFELVLLEKTLNDAFDAADAEILDISDLAEVAPDAWSDLRFYPHPSARRLAFSTNAVAIWLALKNEEAVPDAEPLAAPAHVLVWRQDTTPMFRDLAAEEMMMWDEAAKGVPFGALCSMLATYADPDGAAARGARIICTVTSQMLTNEAGLNQTSRT